MHIIDNITSDLRFLIKVSGGPQFLIRSPLTRVLSQLWPPADQSLTRISNVMGKGPLLFSSGGFDVIIIILFYFPNVEEKHSPA